MSTEPIVASEHPCVGGVPVWNEDCPGCGAFVGANVATRGEGAVTAAFRCCCGRSWASRRPLATEDT